MSAWLNDKQMWKNIDKTHSDILVIEHKFSRNI